MIKLLIALAIIVRVALMPISAHSDLFSIYMVPHLLVKQEILDYYQWANHNVSERHYLSYYPPLTYYSFAAFQVVFQFFSDSFSPWMDKFIELLTSDKLTGQAHTFIKLAPNPNLNRDIFLAKTPYLIFDIATLLVILAFIKKRLLDKNALVLWLFNPALIYSVYIFGQFEVIPAFFVFLGFYLLRKNVYLGLFTLGIAAAYKNYAFIFILPTVLIYGKSITVRAKMAAVAIVPYLIFLSPIILSSGHEAIYALFPKVFLTTRKALEGWVLYSQIFKYSAIITSYLAVLFMSSFLKIKNKWRFSLGLSLVAISIILALWPRALIHYLLWMAPLVIMYFKNLKYASLIILTGFVTFASYNILAPHLQLGLFAPMNPDYFPNLPTFNSQINKLIPYGIISSFGFFVFSTLNLAVVATILKEILFKAKVSVNNLR